MTRTAAILLAAILVCACKPAPKPPTLVAPGLVALPCADNGRLRPHSRGYCIAQRHYMTVSSQTVLLDAARKLQARHPGAAVAYMEASWPIGKRPMPPHLSHGDGRQIDLALLYTDRAGRPLARAPTRSGYSAFEPPRRESERSCTGALKRTGKNDGKDPAVDRDWRLDEARTADLIRILSADPKVRRIFVEPHLKARLGFAADPKVRFAGCKAARHDDHLHVDFF